MAHAPIRSHHVDSADIAPGDRLARWRAAMGDTYAVTLPEDEAPTAFAYRISLWQHDHLLLAHAMFTGRTQRREALNIRRDQVDHFRLILQLEGELQHDADGPRHRVGPGQLLLSDMARPETYRVERGAHLVLFIPRERLEEALPGPYHLHGVILQGPVATVLAQHLVALVAASPRLARPESAALNEATVHLLAATLAPSLSTLGQARSDIAPTLLRQASRYIDLHLDEEDLDAARLCRFFGVSRSSMYRLFEPLGGVANYIRERRLTRACEVLAGGASHAPIAAVAHTFGFRTASQFSRAFRARFGYSPRDVLMQHATPTPTPAAMHDARQPARFSHWLRTLHG